MTKDEWLQLVHRAIERFRTPFFLFSHKPIRKQLDTIKKICGSYVFNWLSLKTLPLRNLLHWWLQYTDLGVEVVSEYELMAAHKEGFPPERIIVNGVAKHSWNKSVWAKGLRVNFDSVREIELLAATALNKRWRTGIRFHPSIQRDPENPRYPDQFGIPANSFLQAVNLLQKHKIYPNTVHIHLRSNIPNNDFFLEALKELELSLKETNIQLLCLDLGGGLPAKGEKQLDQVWHSTFCLEELNVLLHLFKDMFPTIQEFILENGRFVLSECGVLVLTIKDLKEIGGIRQLICDGGRTNHALPSSWQVHEIAILPRRSGKPVYTAVCGPTCMAFDCMVRKKLPCDISVGDKIIWFNAGAYHLSWETRFCQPLARVLWHDDEDKIVEARSPESFEEWWAHWR
jgi:diaminopimelate decarboxylase